MFVQDYLLFEEIFRASTTKCVWETCTWSGIEPEYSNNVEGLDDSHGYNLKTYASLWLAVRD